MRGLRYASRSQLASVVGRVDIEFFRLYGVSPYAEIHADGEVTWFSFGRHDAAETTVLHPNLRESEATAAIDEVLNRFRKRGQPHAWMVGTPSSPGDLGERLVAHGMRLLSEEAAMYLDLGCDLLHPPDVPGLTIAPVRDEKLLLQYAATVQASFGVPDSWSRGLQSAHNILGLSDESPAQCFVGLLDGVPVASACVAYCSEAAGIYNVGVLPHARNRGIAAAVAATACAAARDVGYRYAVLTASQMAVDVYRRLGFHVCGSVKIFVWTPTPPSL